MWWLGRGRRRGGKWGEGRVGILKWWGNLGKYEVIYVGIYGWGNIDCGSFYFSTSKIGLSSINSVVPKKADDQWGVPSLGSCLSTFTGCCSRVVRPSTVQGKMWKQHSSSTTRARSCIPGLQVEGLATAFGFTSIGQCLNTRVRYGQSFHISFDYN